MNLRRFLFLLFVVACALSPPALLAQKSGSITSSECVSIDVTSQSTVGIQVTGTWTGTLQPKISVQGQAPANMQVTPSTSSTAQSTITGNGVYQAKVAGGSTFLLCGATVASGTANVYLNASQATAVIIPPAGTTLAVSTNGTANTDQTTLNFQTSTANSVGLTITPSNPSAGNEKLEVTGSSYTGNAATATNATNATNASNVPFSGVSGATNTAALVEGTSGSVSPSATGQIVGTQAWLVSGIPDPALTANSSGGNLAINNTINVQISFNTALGETIPSRIIGIGTSASCTPDNNSCAVTVTAPTLPTGYTGYTVYSCDGVGCTNLLRQNASNACVNITGNCVIQTAGAGSAPLTVSTAWIAPPNLQATVCPPSVLPQWFIQDSTGNFGTLAGVDPESNTSTLPLPGTLEFCNRVWFNDSGTRIGYKNSMVIIDHLQNGGTTSTANQDRALSVFATNPSTDAGGGGNQSHYALEGIQVEQDLAGTNPVIFGSPDGEASAVSVQFHDGHGGNAPSAALGLNGIRVSSTKSGNGTPQTPTGINGVRINVDDASGSISGGGSQNVDLYLVPPRSFGTITSMNGTGIYIAPLANRMPTYNIGIWIDNYGSNANDASILVSGSSTHNYFQGSVAIGSTFQAMNGNPTYDHGPTTFGLKATAIGALGAAIASVTNIGTPGATTYTYAVVCKDVNGNPTAVSNAVSDTTANATLDGTNHTRVAIFRKAGCWTWDIYRTASGGTPNTTGKIGSVTATLQNFIFNQQTQFDDTGLAGDGTTAPAADQTGGISATRYFTSAVCTAAGTAANPSVVACGSAAAGLVYCDVAASGGTCTVNTTAVTATSSISITPNTADGTALSKTCNGAPTVVPFATLAAKVAATSFTINMPTLTVNGACFEYSIVN